MSETNANAAVNDAEKKEKPYAVLPVNNLKKKIGSNVSLNKIFTPEKIQACQQLIDDSQQKFVEAARECWMELEKTYDAMGGSEAQFHAHIRNILKSTHAFKSHMETLDRKLGFEAAHSLHGFCSKLAKPSNGALVVIKKHMEIMKTALSGEKTTTSAVLDDEIIKNLALLIKKNEK